MLDIIQICKRNIGKLKRLLPILAFIIPLIVLYSLEPASFERTWKGRTFQIFFLWLAILETVLSWEELKTSKLNKLCSLRTVAFVLALSLPTTYVVAANYWGLNAAIVDLTRQSKVYWAHEMPLSTEYVVFTVLFTIIILLAYGIKGPRNYPISVIFLGVIGLIYTIDNLYPYGKFAPFQLLVPATTMLAVTVLNSMGYKTSVSFIENHPDYGSLPYLEVQNSQGKSAGFGIAWPCSGIESLIIYTVTILLFLKKSPIPWKQRLIYFIVGAIVTYFINALRIVSIFLIAIEHGVNSPQVQLFHNYYGQLYSIIWIMSYPLMIIGSQALWGKIRNWKTSTRNQAKILQNRAF